MDGSTQHPIKLSNATLDDLPQHIERPTYDRSKITPGIVHIGLGNFHRAHQAWYTHRLMQSGQTMDWGIIGAGVRPYDEKMREKLLAQDCLTTLVELEPGAQSVEITGAMIDYVPVEEGNGPLIRQLADPAIRIVSMTVTEGGYFLNKVTGEFDADHEEIKFDAANPDKPQTAFGAIIAALKIRKEKGIGPFTCQSCDNLQDNGSIMRQTVVSLARMSDPSLAEWIDSECAFPNSMVDCIVPSTGENEFELVRSLGIEDAAPVTHEDFRQWVIEDKFCAGRPDWDQVGATFTPTVHDYEVMKIRILNGGHQVVANAGELLSIETISGCMEDHQVGALFRKIALDEIAPHVKAVPGMTPDAYIKLIDKRFSNPRIVDTTRRVAFDGSARHPGFIIPSILDAVAAGKPVEGLAFTEAAWARMCDGTREDGSEIEPNDPVWDMLQEKARAAKKRPAAWLEMEEYYGDLGGNEIFAAAFDKWLSKIWEKGFRSAAEDYLNS